MTNANDPSGSVDITPTGQSQVQEQPQVTTVKGKSKQKATTDFFTETAQEVENLTKSKALALADNLAQNVDQNSFKMGGVLKLIHQNGWFEGYESFDQFVYERYGFARRKAFYLIQIYTDLIDKQIPWDKVGHLGWTKIKDLSPILTPENVDEWVAKAEKATVLELQAMLKAKSTGGEVETTDAVTTIKFKLFPDQATTISSALNKAKADAGTEFDATALELICTGYLGGNGDVQLSAEPEKLAEKFKMLGAEVVFAAIGAAFPDLTVTVEEGATA